MTKYSIKIQYFLTALFGILSITIMVVNARLMGEVDTASLMTDLVVATVLALFFVRFCKEDKLFKQMNVKTLIRLAVILMALSVVSLIVNWAGSNSNEVVAVCNHAFAMIAMIAIFILLTCLRAIMMNKFSKKDMRIAAGIVLISCVCALILARAYSVAAFKDIITVFWIYAGALFFVMQKEYLASVSTDRKYILRKKVKWTCIFSLICMAFMLAVTMICASGKAVWTFKENIDNLLHNAALWGKGNYSFELSNLTENDNPVFVLLYYHGYVLVIGYLILNFLHAFVAVKYAKRCIDSSGRSSSTVFLYQAALYALILRFVLSILFGLNLIPLPVHPVMSGQGLGMTFDLIMIILICQNGVKSIRNMNLSRNNDEIKNQ